MMTRFLTTTALSAAALVLVSCGGGGDSNSSGQPVSNAPLIVSAGEDKTSSERSRVTLTGGSTGGVGVKSFSWSQMSGPMILTNDFMGATLNLTMPNVRNDVEATFRLTVTDANNVSATDDVSILIINLGDGPRGPSPQGIPDFGDDRREDAVRDREGRRLFDGREVRTYDGSQNNLANPTWGASFSHLQRLAGSAYGDGVSSMAGPNRVSARVVSNSIVNQDEGVSTPNSFNGSDFVWQWGQFIDHDLDLTDGAEEAADIAIPLGDLHFDPDGTGSIVMGFNRALFDPDTGLTSGNPREQDNEITSWIDGSMVYGSDQERAEALRVGPTSPFLKTSDGNLLPFNEDSLINANGFVQDPTQLFLAGDIRANEQLALAVMHTLFMREHNRMAAELQADFPSRSADEIFEAARRLVVAQIQIITFEEWLPALVGAGAIPPYSGYKPDVNPTIYNEFSAAAFRLGHSMLNEQLLRLDASGQVIDGGHLDLSAAFFTAPMFLRSETDIDPILRGLATQRHQALDETIVNDLRNFLFGAPGDGGLDLASLNIQRGRDHGLPDYNSMRVAMGLSAVTSFDQISSDPDTVSALSSTYATVDDIDLWVGGLSEDPVGNSQLGPLFQRIIVRQFTELRDGDRFWYERDLQPPEMDRVRGTSLARIIRRNTSIGDELQDNVFTAP